MCRIGDDSRRWLWYGSFGLCTGGTRKPKADALGIDPSKEYVAYAKSRNAFPDRIRFETGDAQQLRFGDASFDASVSLLVFNFIPDPMKALREVRRVANRGEASRRQSGTTAMGCGCCVSSGTER